MGRSTQKMGIILFLMVFFSVGCSDDAAPGADLGPGTDGAVDSGAPDAAAREAGAGDAGIAPVVISTASGPVKGKLLARSRAFLGIPYAAPPTGKNRFKPPQPVQPWTKPRDATAFGPSCIQAKSMAMGLTTGFSEDCLTLNVFSPLPVPDKAPVLVWLHGGGFVSGGSSLPTYNGQALAETRGVVVVTLNYRLGPMGFFTHPAVEGGAANAGLLDQQAALTWVKDNIAAFGGDPTNVTLFGESAGSISTCLHLMMPGSQGLLHRAAMQSGVCTYGHATLAAAQKQGAELAKAVKCDAASDVAACLRAVPAETLFSALPLRAGFIYGTGVAWSPVVDKKVIPGDPRALLKAGTYQKVPVLLGTNQDEGTLFLFLTFSTKMTESEYKTIVSALVPGKQSEILSRYPVKNYTATAMFSAPALAFADMLADLAFTCPARAMARTLAAAGQKAHLYRFTVTPSFGLLSFLGAYHSAEIPFVFHSSDAFSAAEKTLSAQMAAYWTRFAQSGAPGGSGKAAWPAYSKAADAHLTLSTAGISQGSGLHSARCDFWDTIQPPQ